MTHFTEAELKRWSVNGPGADRDRVMSHVVECSACMHAYSASVRENRLVQTDASEDLSEFVQAGYASRHRGAQSKLFTMAKWVVPIAAAAAIAVAVSLPRLRQIPTPSNQISLRGVAVQPLSPQGDSANIAEFRWMSSVSASKYVITIGEQTAVITTADSSGTTWRPSPQQIASFKPGHTYWWTVVALDEQGSVIVSSEKQPFTVRQP